MNFTDEQASVVLKTIEDNLRASNDPPSVNVRNMWLYLLATQSRVLTNTVRNMVGDAVIGGIFKGMKLTQEAFNAYNACILLGTYEYELHPVFEKIIAEKKYTRILNIGCSIGYYAVGLALRMPHMVIDAFDIDPEARRKCTEMAALNGVQDRVRISGVFNGEDFATYANEKTLAIVDIEGAERSLLDPTLYPALKNIDMIVELHGMVELDLPEIVVKRFAASHNIDVILNKTVLPDLTGLVAPNAYIDPFDHLLLGWEGRGGATPWGIFTARHSA